MLVAPQGQTSVHFGNKHVQLVCRFMAFTLLFYKHIDPYTYRTNYVGMITGNQEYMPGVLINVYVSLKVFFLGLQGLINITDK